MAGESNCIGFGFTTLNCFAGIDTTIDSFINKPTAQNRRRYIDNPKPGAHMAKVNLVRELQTKMSKNKC